MMLQMLMGFGGAGSAPVGYSTGVITGATWVSGISTNSGFDATHGSSTGTALPGSRTLTAMYDIVNFDEYLTSYEAVLVITGFASDPGVEGYFSQASVGGVTLTAATAVYSYAAGGGQWSWPYQLFGISGSGTTDWTLS
jgi:hypothetical protein